MLQSYNLCRRRRRQNWGAATAPGGALGPLPSLPFSHPASPVLQLPFFSAFKHSSSSSAVISHISPFSMELDAHSLMWTHTSGVSIMDELWATSFTAVGVKHPTPHCVTDAVGRYVGISDQQQLACAGNNVPSQKQRLCSQNTFHLIVLCPGWHQSERHSFLTLSAVNITIKINISVWTVANTTSYSHHIKCNLQDGLWGLDLNCIHTPIHWTKAAGCIHKDFFQQQSEISFYWAALYFINCLH